MNIATIPYVITITSSYVVILYTRTRAIENMYTNIHIMNMASYQPDIVLCNNNTL